MALERQPITILVVSDRPERALDDVYDPARWQGVDLIISCGDLSATYLSNLVSRLNVPLYYVRGNHDTGYQEAPPEGGEDISGRLVEYRGWRFLGLDGAPRYNGEPLQYSDAAMARRALWLTPRLWLAGGFDVLVTHAPPAYCDWAYTRCCPPAGAGRLCRYNPNRICLDADDRAHWGFRTLTSLIQRYQPAYALHGHCHLTYARVPREVRLGKTRVLNAFGHVIVRLTPDVGAEKGEGNPSGV